MPDFAMQTHDIEVDVDGSQRVVGRTPGIKQYVALPCPWLATFTRYLNIAT